MSKLRVERVPRCPLTTETALAQAAVVVDPPGTDWYAAREGGRRLRICAKSSEEMVTRR